MLLPVVTPTLDFGQFLSTCDALRVERVLDKLRLRGLEEFALTGGLAMEANLCFVGRARQRRKLNDLDIVVDSFNSIPGAMASDDLLVRHLHPKAPKGKILIQLVDPDQAVRIDVFRSYGATLRRSQFAYLGSSKIRIVSIEELAARATSLILGLERGTCVPRKHAEDLNCLVDWINMESVETVWQEHRKRSEPLTFREALIRVRKLVNSHHELLVVPEYSLDVDSTCAYCEDTGPFRLSSARKILSILGYC